MNKIIASYRLGSVKVLYTGDETGHVGFSLIPSDRENDLAPKNYHIEPLVQVHIRGDAIGGGYVNGLSMSGSGSNAGFVFASQRQEGNRILTTLSDPKGRVIRHIVESNPEWDAVVVHSEFINGGAEPLCLELLTSLCLGAITPFETDDAPGALVRHLIKSAWSAEGRLISDPIERINMEPSWSTHAVRIEKIGQVGSMPVRGYFPFAAVEDCKNHVTWGVQLACSASWQIELKRRDDALSILCGPGDYDYAHWAKELAPGESFSSPEAIVTAVSGSLTEATYALLSVQKQRNAMQLDPLPLLFNEYCTTWGEPSDENVSRILDVLKGRGFDIFVLDAGWYCDDIHKWSEINGDWNVSPRLFPNGIRAVVDKIHAAGMKAGIWFELETCSGHSAVSKNTDWLLKRSGSVLTVGDGKLFLDMRNKEVADYLTEKVIHFLRDNGFDYIKVDYNDSIGVGCDGAESLGEGLRQNMEGTCAFFRKMREELPDLMIENCSSGGHRLEPLMMSLSSMASFSDAHECPEIPVIAANLHRVILPGQSQIWAVMRAGDSLQRITYSLCAAMLGVMCLSGDIAQLDAQQLAQIDLGTKFYRKVSSIIRDGRSEIRTEGLTGYRHLTGFQVVSRVADSGDEMLIVVHSFRNPGETTISVPIKAGFAVTETFHEENVSILRKEDALEFTMKRDFTAAAVHLAAARR